MERNGINIALSFEYVMTEWNKLSIPLFEKGTE